MRAHRWAWTCAFWLLVGLGAGTTAFLAERDARGASLWAAHTLPPLLAGLCWIPLTATIFALARRLPLAESGRGRRGAVHLVLSLLAGFALNALYAPLSALLGQIDWRQVPETIREAGLRWMHINAGVYWVLLAIGHALARESTRTDEARRARARSAEPVSAPATDPTPARLRVSSGAGWLYLPIDQIDWIEGAGDYARIHAGGRELLCDRRLKELEARLRRNRFARIHRSTIVNLERVRALRHVSHGDYEAELSCGARLRVARSRRDSLLAAMRRLLPRE